MKLEKQYNARNAETRLRNFRWHVTEKLFSDVVFSSYVVCMWVH